MNKIRTRNAKENSIAAIILSLIVMYVVSGLLLLVLAFLLYKMELSESVIRIAVIVIYLIAGLLGGILIGKKMKDRRFLWGLLIGVVYFILLFIISFVFKKGADLQPVKAVTTLILCAASGMAGGMIG